MITHKIKVLVIEDNQMDKQMINKMLNMAQNMVFDPFYVNTLSLGLECLSGNHVDVVLLDLNLPDSQRGDTFSRVHIKFPHVPVVIFSGLDDEDIALFTVQNGAQEYLIKGRTSCELLERTLQRAVLKEKMQRIEEISTSTRQALYPPLQVILGYSNLLSKHNGFGHLKTKWTGKLKDHANKLEFITRKFNRIVQ